MSLGGLPHVNVLKYHFITLLICSCSADLAPTTAITEVCDPEGAEASTPNNLARSLPPNGENVGGREQPLRELYDIRLINSYAPDFR
jgi:hypothetical protein